MNEYLLIPLAILKQHKKNNDQMRLAFFDHCIFEIHEIGLKSTATEE